MRLYKTNISIFNSETFSHSNFAVFQPLPKTITETIDKKPDYISKCKTAFYLSSMYWFTKEGIIRVSDHWGSVGKFRWYLKDYTQFKFNKEYRLKISDYCGGFYESDPISFKDNSKATVGFCSWNKLKIFKFTLYSYKYTFNFSSREVYKILHKNNNILNT